MIAKAPGKLVLSGAYAVLAGAPAIVTAVDRYAVADASRSPFFVTAEVQAAIDGGDLLRAPWFDASALRAPPDKDGTSRKLGLGSSAAILVASMAAAMSADQELPLQRLFERARGAHRRAQGGGSGVDVAASVFGGTRQCQLLPQGDLLTNAHALPGDMHVLVFSSTEAADTSHMLKAVRAFSRAEPAHYGRLISHASAASEQAVRAPSASSFAECLHEQNRALQELGERASVPIVPDALKPLVERARAERASFGPSGAGGGDIAIYVADHPPSKAFLMSAEHAKLVPLDIHIGARGVHRAPA